MCGITLAGCKSVLGFGERSHFENMLFMDTIRGYHATGVIAGYHIPTKNESYAIYAKTGDPAPAFLESAAWAAVKEQTYKSQYGASNIARAPHFLIGHNRHATKGAKTAKNAHPFVHDHITMVHNGTLIDQSLLPESSRFEVDSDNISFALSTIGTAETIQKLNGAYTLVWHDDKEQTVNIIRNDQRPFHLLRTAGNTWYGASEEEMLLWLLTRDDKYSLTKSSPKIAEHFECEVGVQYVFDVSGGKFEPKLLKDEAGAIIPDSWKIKHELPVFAKKHASYSYNYDYSHYNNRNKSAAAKENHGQNYTRRTSDEILKNAGLDLKIGGKLCFEGFNQTRYPGRPSHGMLTGWLPKHEAYIEVQCHSHPYDMYEEGGIYFADIVSAYMLNAIVHIVVRNAKFEDDTIIDPPQTDIPVVVNPQLLLEPPKDEEMEGNNVVIMEDSEIYTKEEWNTSPQATCTSCNTHIDFEEAEHATATPGGYICMSCVQDMRDELESEGVSDEDAPFHDQFLCIMCGQSKSEAEESPSANVCCRCFDSFFDGTHVYQTNQRQSRPKEVVLEDGSMVNESEWEVINECIQCGQHVPFSKAEDCLVRQHGILCQTCSI